MHLQCEILRVITHSKLRLNSRIEVYVGCRGVKGSFARMFNEMISRRNKKRNFENWSVAVESHKTGKTHSAFAKHSASRDALSPAYDLPAIDRWLPKSFR